MIHMSNGFFRLICHQSPDRCIKINEKPMPICARCTGFYAGLVIGTVINFFIRTIIYMYWLHIIIIVFIGLAPMVIDGFTQLKGLRESNNTFRLITGFLAGFTCGIIVVYLGVNLTEMAGI